MRDELFYRYQIDRTMKFSSILIFISISTCCVAQTVIRGTVADSKTKTPLLFCQVAIKGTTRCCISNEEGVYSFYLDTIKDTLVFSYVGYEQRIIPASEVLRNPVVLMKSKSI